MELAKLTRRRRRKPLTATADPTIRALRLSDLERAKLVVWCAGAVLGAVAIARHPLPAGIPLAGVYAAVNTWSAVRDTRRDLRRIRHARDFHPDRPVQIVEPAAPWEAFWPTVAIFVVWTYFDGPAAPGRFIVAAFVPLLVQTVVTTWAVARRERQGVELFVWYDEGVPVVVAQGRLVPLSAAY